MFSNSALFLSKAARNPWAAFDLLKVLEENCRGIENVIILTNGLKDIYPYGRDLFNKNLHGLIDKHARLVFIGAHEE